MKTLKCGILNKYCYTYFQMESSVHVYFRSWLLTHVTRTINQHRINSKMHTFSWLLGWSTQGQGISAIQQYQAGGKSGSCYNETKCKHLLYTETLNLVSVLDSFILQQDKGICVRKYKQDSRKWSSSSELFSWIWFLHTHFMDLEKGSGSNMTWKTHMRFIKNANL